MKNKVGLIGSGNIGWAIEALLADKYDLKVGDLKDGLDATNESQVEEFLRDRDAVISAGPFAVNKTIALVAAKLGIGYFDLTEDVATTEFVTQLKTTGTLIPQCGLAPGAINICAAHMMKGFEIGRAHV